MGFTVHFMLMRFSILVAFVIIASFFVSGIIPSNAYALPANVPKGDFKSMTETGKGRVAEIIDPLTLRLDDGTIVSMTGLDYPDLDYYAPGNFSIMTLKILKDFLVDREVILYQTEEDGLGRTNRMGHAVAHIVRRDDDAWVQGLMISLGLARVRTTKSNPEMADQMYAIEDVARTAKTGIWAVKGLQILNGDQSRLMIGSYQIVEAEVVKAAMQKNRLFLNFGKDWRKDFTISISASNRKLFAAQNLDPQSWAGKKIRVRGWLESFNGPYIDVDHPQQIELLFKPEELPEAEGDPKQAEQGADKKEGIKEKHKPSVIKRSGAE